MGHILAEQEEYLDDDGVHRRAMATDAWILLRFSQGLIVIFNLSPWRPLKKNLVPLTCK